MWWANSKTRKIIQADDKPAGDGWESFHCQECADICVNFGKTTTQARDFNHGTPDEKFCTFLTACLLILLCLVSLAGCGFPEPGSLLTPTATATATPAATITANPTSPQESPTAPQNATRSLCTVTTGLDSGALNLRTCGAVSCEVLAVLAEGDTLTITQTVNGWHSVTTSAGLHGWVNSDYCK